MTCILDALFVSVYECYNNDFIKYNYLLAYILILNIMKNS